MSHLSIRLALALALAAAVHAQTGQATLQGVVRDQGGAIVPEAKVTLIADATGVSREVASNNEGRFVLPFLLPGSYEVRVEKAGFRGYQQKGLKLDVQQNLSLDVQLSIGDVTTTVQVSDTTPPLDTGSSTVSTTLGNKSVSDLPLIGRSVIGLANLLPGVLPPQGSAGSGGGYGPTIGGGRTGAGDIRVDGTSMMLSDANNGILVMGGSLPNVDAVEEFSVVVNTLAAEYGRSGSGAILIASKSGTNKIHGSVYDFFRNNQLNANNFFSNRTGGKLASFNSHQFGFSLGGPVWLPKLYNGRNRTFFFADYQGTRARSPSNFTGTVPIDAWKQGDFSDLRNSAGQPILIYDPLTISTTPDSTGNYLRQPFAGNRIPSNRIDPVARNLLTYYPQPNTTPTNQFTQLNNFFRSQISPDRNDNFTGRIDHNFSDHWRSFWRFTKGISYTNPPNVFGNPGTPLGRSSGSTPRHSFTWNNIYTLNSTTFFDLTYGMSRFSNSGNPPSAGFDLTSLGLPAYMQQQANKDIYSRFPNVAVNGMTNLGQQTAAGIRFTPTSHNLAASMTKVLSRHTIKAGLEYRKFFLNFWQEATPGGAFSYGQDWTQQNPVRNVATQGFGVASLLLGLGSGSQQNNLSQALTSSYWGGFIQDDFHVSRKLTFNLGLRYELDVPRTERYDRMSYWDANATSAIAGQVPGFSNLRGAMNFVTADNRRQTPADKNNVSPRFGFVYQWNAKTVIRGGYAYMYAPSITQATYGNGGFQGFRCSTSMVTSLDGGRTPLAYLRDPFPNGFCPTDGAKPGPYSGANTALGQAIGESWFPDWVNPNVQQWSFNVQRELPGKMIVEAGYIGNKGNHLIDGGRSAYNQLPEQYMSLGNSLNDNVANPFFGVITDPTSTMRLATVQRRQLLSPYPQYTGVNATARPTGNSLYHSYVMRVQKRFSSGVGFLVAFTAGKELTDSGWGNTITSINASTGRQNVYDRKSDRALSPDDISRRLVMSFNAELPFGRGRRYFTNIPRVADLALGGWQFNGIVTLQSGLPVTLFSSVNQTGINSAAQRPNNNGVSANLGGNRGTTDQQINRWFDTSVFAVAAPFTFGNAPTVLPDVRIPGIRNCDLSLFKNFAILSENKLTAQFRLEASNALNTTQLGRPGSTVGVADFGVISGVGVGPRSVQLALKILF